MSYTPLAFTLSEDLPIKTIAELKADFYEANLIPRNELKKKFKRQYGRHVYDPIALALNPSGWGNTGQALESDVYIAVYPSHFYVRIECGQAPMSGPHKFELCYQARIGLHVFLGCFNSRFSFFDQDFVSIKLARAITERQYFCTKLTSQRIVELGQVTSPEIKL